MQLGVVVAIRLVVELGELNKLNHFINFKIKLPKEGMAAGKAGTGAKYLKRLLNFAFLVVQL